MLELHSKAVGNKKLKFFTWLRKGSSEFWPLATLFPQKKKKRVFSFPKIWKLFDEEEFLHCICMKYHGATCILINDCYSTESSA